MKKIKKESETKFFGPLFFSALFLYASNVYSMPSADASAEQGTEQTEAPADVGSDANIMQNLIPTAPSPDTQPTGQGLETIQISDEKTGDQGNWVKKKNWLLKSYEISNNIFSLASQIAETKKIYQGKYSAIDDELDKFYKDLGIEQGKIKELFESISRYLEKKKKKETAAFMAEPEKSVKKDRDFRAKIEVLENQIKNLSKDLEQLRLNIEAIADVDKNALTESLKMADREIVASMSLAESAKSKIEALWDIIDDKKARSIYYEVLNIEEELKSKLSYLKDPLAGYFNKYVDLAREKINDATATIKKLEEKGIIVKDRASRIEQLKLAELKKLELEATQAQKVETPAVEVKKEPELGITQKIYSLAITWFAKIYNFITNIFSKKEIDRKKQVPQEQAVQQSAQPTQIQSPVSLPPMPTQVPTALTSATTPTSTIPLAIPLTDEIPTAMPLS